MTAGGFPRAVALYGAGLIGASFALALKKYIPGVHVHGIDTPEVLDRARSLGAVDSGPQDAPDLVVLAAPVGAILHLLDELEPTAALILDVGSTKVEICRKAELRRLPFVGGHPMAGSERSGPEAASSELFRDAAFFLCPVSTAPENAVAVLSQLVESMGARPEVIAAEEHDTIAAQLSHLPQILSSLLAGQTADRRGFAGTGWKSVTRLAASPFHVWRDILQTSGALPQELRSFSAQLRAVTEALETGDLGAIEAMFERANRSVAGDPHE